MPSKSSIQPKRDLYRILSAFEREDMPTLFKPAIDRAYSVLARFGSTAIPTADEALVRREIGNAVTAIFVTPLPTSPFPDGRAAFADDGFTALSPYARALNRRLVEVAAKVVGAHYRYMRDRLPSDIVAWLTRNPITEQAHIFKSNPLAQYEPAHTWVDPNGYQLSSRIWNLSATTRLQVDRLIADAIRQGRSALDLARDLERFLMPGQLLRRTKKPYGRDANYPALRLARTEIARAHSAATFAASRGNPYVSGMDWALSARHPKFDVCDTLATIGMSGQRLREAYPLESAPQVVTDSHPNCICTNRPFVDKDEARVVEELREAMRLNLRPYLTPMLPMRFIEALIGAALITLVLEWFSEITA